MPPFPRRQAMTGFSVLSWPTPTGNRFQLPLQLAIALILCELEIAILVALGGHHLYHWTDAAAVAEMLGKPERYVMVSLDAGRPMLFAGDDASACSAAINAPSIGTNISTKSSEFSSGISA